MSSKVYFKPVSAKAPADEICRTAGELLSAYLERENVQLEKKIPLKVHFGERGNRTYLVPHTYDAIIDLLEKRGVESFFAETSVLYGGERFNREKHLKLAQAHGFTRIPAVIADGAHGEEAEDVEVNLKYFRYCSLGKLLADSPQTLVLSHFKGHMLAGFGGAIKQLSMGFASKGGKMAMHLGVKPKIWNFLCKRCKLCMTRCQRNAITIGKKSFIVSILNLSSLWNALFGKQIFREKLVEYAYASHHGKRNIYMNFAVNVTAGCDCEPRPMRPCVDNIGIFISADPVAIDTACLEAVQAKGRHFKGAEQLAYAEKIGLGSRKYEIINI